MDNAVTASCSSFVIFVHVTFPSITSAAPACRLHFDFLRSCKHNTQLLKPWLLFTWQIKLSFPDMFESFAGLPQAQHVAFVGLVGLWMV
ncbi:MAG: hypothetical protein ABI169_10665 [Chitinophagaceae bacterium]